MSLELADELYGFILLDKFLASVARVTSATNWVRQHHRRAQKGRGLLLGRVSKTLTIKSLFEAGCFVGI
ncbi:MAG: hypothetical protein KBC73_02240 [Burkholderiaceae bacterium]|nr:hypothetical protein [Burkholderiaceae bacterium]